MWFNGLLCQCTIDTAFYFISQHIHSTHFASNLPLYPNWRQTTFASEVVQYAEQIVPHLKDFIKCPAFTSVSLYTCLNVSFYDYWVLCSRQHSPSNFSAQDPLTCYGSRSQLFLHSLNLHSPDERGPRTQTLLKYTLGVQIIMTSTPIGQPIRNRK